MLFFVVPALSMICPCRLTNPLGKLDKDISDGIEGRGRTDWALSGVDIVRRPMANLILVFARSVRLSVTDAALHCRPSNLGGAAGAIPSDVICHNSAISEIRNCALNFWQGKSQERPTDRGRVRPSLQFERQCHGESGRGRLKNVRPKGADVCRGRRGRRPRVMALLERATSYHRSLAHSLDRGHSPPSNRDLDRHPAAVWR